MFHFVVSEPLTAETGTAGEADPNMWVLMDRGRCHAVMARVSGRPEPELDRALLEWLEHNIAIPRS